MSIIERYHCSLMFIHLESSEGSNYTMEQKEAVDKYVSSIITCTVRVIYFYMLNMYNVVYLSE